MTHFDQNDPRLTAFALDELTGDERAEFETHVASCAECVKLVDDVRQLGELVTASVRQDGTVPQKLTQLPLQVASKAPVRRWNRRRVLAYATAASVIGIGVTILLFVNSGNLRSLETHIVASFGNKPEEVLNQITEEEIKPAKELALISTAVSQSVGAQGAVSNLPADARRAVGIPVGTNDPVPLKVDIGEVNVFKSTGTPYGATRPAPNANSPRPPIATKPQAGSAVAPTAARPSSISGPQPSMQPSPVQQVTSAVPMNKLLEEAERKAWAVQHEGREFGDVQVVREAPRRNTESYARIHDNPFLDSKTNPLSTFSIDVDTGSYSNVRRFLTGNQLPPPDAVRIEELLNYFSYDYAPPTGEHPFAAHVEVASAPWMPAHRLVRVGIKGKVVTREQRPAANLVFLIDVSGSMSSDNKLPLVKQALKLLVEQLDEKDRVSMVVYAGASGLVLDTTPAYQKETILTAIDRLQSGGSTNGGAGIQLAYAKATEAFIKEGVNRVILATDGDFNVGITNQGELTRLIEKEAKSGVFLSVLGFGMGNLKDATLEQLADKGNGTYGYIDTVAEARKVFVEQVNGTLLTIAKDVKIQIEFNPAQVASYRLIGYENRLLRKEDFNDDTKDAGEIGAGHTVTALYEVVPVGVNTRGANPATPAVDPLKYQTPPTKPQPEVKPTDAANTLDELLTLKLRYKQPDGDKSTLIETPIKDSQTSFEQASGDFRFAASVAAFGMRLRGSEHAGDISWPQIIDFARRATGEDANGYRHEFVTLAEQAAKLSGKK
ncbi:MAG: von Willebrand factor type A domain-containing protein [Planctomycetaceae bacterium]|nr:von Willebrand factor type A domain-containing protein [Planctomycetaceae bacterium]